MYNPAASRNSLVFIDSQVANANEPKEDIASEVEVIFQDAINSGVAQGTEALTRHTTVSSIYIVSQTKGGSLQLGSTQLIQHTLKPNFATFLQLWAKAFTLDIYNLLYACLVPTSAHSRLCPVISSDNHLRPRILTRALTHSILGYATKVFFGWRQIVLIDLRWLRRNCWLNKIENHIMLHFWANFYPLGALYHVRLISRLTSTDPDVGSRSFTQPTHIVNV